MARNTSGSVIPQISYVFGEFQAEFEGIINTFQGLAVEMRVFSISEDPSWWKHAAPTCRTSIRNLGSCHGKCRSRPGLSFLETAFQLLATDWRRLALVQRKRLAKDQLDHELSCLPCPRSSPRKIPKRIPLFLPSSPPPLRPPFPPLSFPPHLQATMISINRSG